jgi:hypothetical protein
MAWVFNPFTAVLDYTQDVASLVIGTANQIVVTPGAGGIVTLSTPQNIHTGATPTFAGLTLSPGAGNIFVVDTSTLVVDATNHWIGIGTTAPTGPLHMQSNVAAEIKLETFLNGVSGARIIGAKGRGTAAAPRRTKSGDVVTNTIGRGFYAADDATDAIQTGNVATFRWDAAEDYTSTNQGNRFVLNTTAIGATAVAARLTVNESGAVFSAGITHGSATLLTTTVNLTNGAAAQVATLNNGPLAGDPTKWVPVNDNGTTRYVPLW